MSLCIACIWLSLCVVPIGLLSFSGQHNFNTDVRRDTHRPFQANTHLGANGFNAYAVFHYVKAEHYELPSYFRPEAICLPAFPGLEQYSSDD